MPYAPRDVTPSDALSPLPPRRAGRALAAVCVVGALAVVAYGPIPQPADYHGFADTRTMLGVPNAMDVLSNLGFLVAGAVGLITVARRNACRFREPWERTAWLLVFLGSVLTAVGSSWYHVAPNDASLFWDRLPMTLVFTSLFAAMIGERVNPVLGRRLLWPMILVGGASVLVWRITGDLRAYIIVQYVPLLALVGMLVVQPPSYTRTKDLYLVAVAYALAKICENTDCSVYDALGVISGHTLKHLFAAIAPVLLVRHLVRRKSLHAA